jgi:hypothetical protein
MIGDFDMKLTQMLAKRYKDASRKTKSEMITEYCQLTQTSRNTASKRFCKQIKNPYPRALPATPTPNKRGPKKKFRGVHVRIVKKCWELAGSICAERLHPMLCTYIDQLQTQGVLRDYTAHDIAIVKSISVATLKRVIATFPRANNKKHKGNDFIYRQVPIVAHFGKFSDTPGYVEIDYVEHNGGSSSGLFIITGTYTDIFSGWTARGAGLGKNLSSVSSIDTTVHTRIFHPVIHYHPDNDKSILKILFERMNKNNEDNNNGKGKGQKQRFSLSRSRPYQKNDNAHVEQKNGDKVRKLVGYWRYDTDEELELLNLLYEKSDLLDNFFIPAAKLKEKIRDTQGRVIRRVHDKPKTPYQRLMDCECEQISEQTKQKLKSIYGSLNMIELRMEINKILQELYKIQLTRSRKKIMS